MKKQFRNFPVEIEAEVDTLCQLDIFGAIWTELERLDHDLTIIKDKRFERSIRKTPYHTITLPNEAMEHFAAFINRLQTIVPIEFPELNL